VLKHALVPENAEGFLAKLKRMTLRSTAMIADPVMIQPVA